MKARQARTLKLIFARPVSGSVRWKDLEALFVDLGAKINEAEGSRVAVVLFGEVRVFHRRTPAQIPTKVPPPAFANGWNPVE